MGGVLGRISIRAHRELSPPHVADTMGPLRGVTVGIGTLYGATRAESTTMPPS